MNASFILKTYFSAGILGKNWSFELLVFMTLSVKLEMPFHACSFCPVSDLVILCMHSCTKQFFKD